MSEIFKIYFLSSTTRTCFFYLNENELENEKWTKSGVKVQYGDNYEKHTYGSISFQSLPEVPHKSLGISCLLGNRLGLRVNDEVCVTPCSVDSVQSLEISPKKEEDYVILLSCKSILESHLLNQVHVVAEGQTLPLYVFSNIVIDVEIGKLQSKSSYGKLEKFTEITIIHPLERPKTYTNSSLNSNLETPKNKLNNFFDEINKALEEVHPSVRYMEESNEEVILKEILKSKKKSQANYEIKPSFLLESEIPQRIVNRFIVVSHFENISNVVGPSCAKVFVKVQKVVKEEEKDAIKLHTIVISLNKSTKNVAYCPPYIMKKLKLSVGSSIHIERVKPDLSLLFPCKMYCKQELEQFWNSLAEIREKVKKVVVNNIKYNHKINSLIVGCSGSGKTFLLQDVANEFSDEFINYKLVNCNTLRGKKLESLLKHWNDFLKYCALHEPSLLILDDLHALTYIDNEEEQFNKLYSNRVVDLITWCIREYQERYNISVIASATNMSQLASFVSKHGPRLFECVHNIPEMNPSERLFTLESLITKKHKSTHQVDLDRLVESTNGYTIQDLNDLVDKAVFNYLLRVESPCEQPTPLNQVDFDSVLHQVIPSALQKVKLKDNIEKKWEDVGGMAEPKKILSEVFLWPSKYPKLLESCPLRIQRGVLLYGAPGTGKTILAGALANKCGFNFISVKGPEVLSKYVGASEEGVRNLFVQAQKTHPCLLFFDEFDSLAPQRGHDSTGVTDRVVNQLLTQLDGVEALSGVWVLAATSRPDLIDPALLRPGRLDKLVYCGIPNKEDRLSILKSLSRNLPVADDVDFLEVAEKLEGYTGADIQAILYNAQMSVVKDNINCLENGVKTKVTQAHLLSAITETKPSLSTVEKLKYEQLYERFLDSRKQGSSKSYGKVQRVTFA